MEKRTRIDFINVLQVIGPILVILGHSINGIPLNGPWFIFSKEWIYIFHMPFFFIISGFLLSKNGWLKQGTYKQFIWKKFVKLIIPYTVWNLAFLIPKYMVQGLISDEVTMSLKGAVRMFFYPRQNVWGHTWFLVGLFMLYCLTPFWKRIIEKKTFTIIAVLVGIMIYMVPLGTEFLCFSDLHKDTLFFVIGCYFGTVNLERLKLFLKRERIILGILGVVTSYVALFVVNDAWFDWIPCLAIILFLWSISIMFENKAKLVDIMARRSFGIYILHWPAMLFARIIFVNIFHVNVVVTIVVMILCGYLVPNIILSILKKIKIKSIQRVCMVLLGI